MLSTQTPSNNNSYKFPGAIDNLLVDWPARMIVVVDKPIMGKNHYQNMTVRVLSSGQLQLHKLIGLFCLVPVSVHISMMSR
jgi:hypothetical protein